MIRPLAKILHIVLICSMACFILPLVILMSGIMHYVESSK
jgi:hypothetical protein